MITATSSPSRASRRVHRALAATSVAIAAAVPTIAVSAATEPASEAIGGSVTVWSAWGGVELAAFEAVLAPFEERTGIDVEITTVRDPSQIAINVEAGTELPDIAFPPSQDELAEWASRGVVKAVDDAIDLDDYNAHTFPALLDLGEIDGSTYLVFVRTQLKGLFWYDPENFTGTPPETWEELLSIPVEGDTKLFCIGLESGAASGWPATDILENLFMRQSGAEKYRQWASGELAWDSPEVRAAFEAYGAMVSPENVFGGTETMLTTNFAQVGRGLFNDPPGCLFTPGATFMPSMFAEADPGAVSGVDYDFFPHPSLDPANEGNVEGFADAFVMFNDTPQSQALMAYLATAEAQTVFVEQGGSLAARSDVTSYPDPLFARAAELAANADNLLLDASDTMPLDMVIALLQGVLQYTSDPDSLDQVLADLERVRLDVYAE